MTQEILKSSKRGEVIHFPMSDGGLVLKTPYSFGDKKRLNKNRVALLRNEAQVLDKAQGKINGSFAVPLLSDEEFRDGIIEMNYVDGTFFGERKAYDILVLPHDIVSPKFVDYLVTLVNFNPGELPYDSGFRNLAFLNWISSEKWLKPIWLAKSLGYLAGINIHIGENLFSTIINSKISQTGFNHCNIRPEHLIKTIDDYASIDWEWATNKFPKHYDVCYLADVLGIAHGRSYLAEKLLHSYREALHPSERQYFDDTCYGLLAIRALGELRDMSSGVSMHKEHFFGKGKGKSGLVLDHYIAHIVEVGKFISKIETRTLL